MQLLTQEIRAVLPALYANEDKNIPEVVAVVKWFTPSSNWTWYVTEFDTADTCFGLVVGHETELGYFSLSEISQVAGPFGLTVERDLHFKPTKLSEIRDPHVRAWVKMMTQDDVI